MRIRSTKPEFWRSERVASVSWDARLVLKGLESYVDDNGVGKHALALIIGDLFQRDLVREPSRTLARVADAISELNQAGMLWLYEHDGTDLLFIAFWDQIQRVDKPQAGRFPRPDGTMNYKESVIRECVANSRESSGTLATFPARSRGTGEQGNRGTGDDDGPPARDSGHDAAVVVEHSPEHPASPTRPPRRQPTGPAAAVVLQTLGDAGYPRTTIDRLAVQVGELAREGHPDSRIREALVEWDQRSGDMKPEYLPTVLGDIVKRSRAAPGSAGGAASKLRATAELAERMRREETQAARKELA